MSRSCFSLELYKSPNTSYNRQLIEIKYNFAKALSHIDYMLFQIEAGYIRDTRITYCDNNSVEQLKELLSKRLIDYSLATKYRDTGLTCRNKSKKRKYKDLRLWKVN